MHHLKKFFEYNENSETIYQELKRISKEISKGLICDKFGSCVHFAELFTLKVGEKNTDLLNHFQVVEGYVIDSGQKFEHTWVLLENGELIDPTFQQFSENGERQPITKEVHVYSGKEYFDECENPSWWHQERIDAPEHVWKPGYY